MTRYAGRPRPTKNVRAREMEREKTAMEGITHRTIAVNGINMHVAEKGEGPIVLLIHGFPELWYSWRHQIVGLAAKGYRAIAPDLRGYGDTDAPPSASDYTIFHLVGDLVSLLDVLGEDRPALVVGHDWGAIVAWHLCMFRPDRVKGLVNMSVPFMPRNPSIKTVDGFRDTFGDDFYICRFQEPGAIEAEFAKHDTALLLGKFLSSRDPTPPRIPKLGGWRAPKAQVTLPSWLSEEDIDYYANKFDKSGFTGGLNYYRCMNLNWELTAPWTGVQIKVPVKFIVGDLDMTYHIPGIQDYLHKGMFKKDVPLLEDLVVMEGVGHYINQEKPHEITQHIHEFFVTL